MGLPSLAAESDCLLCAIPCFRIVVGFQVFFSQPPADTNPPLPPARLFPVQLSGPLDRSIGLLKRSQLPLGFAQKQMGLPSLAAESDCLLCAIPRFRIVARLPSFLSQPPADTNPPLPHARL